MRIYAVNGSEGYGFVSAQDENDAREVWAENVEDAESEADMNEWAVVPMSDEDIGATSFGDEDEPGKITTLAEWARENPDNRCLICASGGCW